MPSSNPPLPEVSKTENSESATVQEEAKPIQYAATLNARDPVTKKFISVKNDPFGQSLLGRINQIISDANGNKDRTVPSNNNQQQSTRDTTFTRLMNIVRTVSNRINLTLDLILKSILNIERHAVSTLVALSGMRTVLDNISNQLRRNDRETKENRAHDKIERPERPKPQQNSSENSDPHSRPDYLGHASTLGNGLLNVLATLVNPEAFMSMQLTRLKLLFARMLFETVNGALHLVFKGLPIEALALGVIDLVKDGIKGWFSSQEHETDHLAGAIGEALAGGGKLWNGLKFGGIGAGIGFMFGGPIGAIAGAIVGGVVGVLLAAIGPEKISHWVEEAEVGILSFLNNVFGTNFKSPELVQKADKLRKIMEDRQKELNDNIQQISNLTNQIAAAEKSGNTALKESLEHQRNILQENSKKLTDSADKAQKAYDDAQKQAAGEVNIDLTSVLNWFSTVGSSIKNFMLRVNDYSTQRSLEINRDEKQMGKDWEAAFDKVSGIIGDITSTLTSFINSATDMLGKLKNKIETGWTNFKNKFFGFFGWETKPSVASPQKSSELGGVNEDVDVNTSRSLLSRLDNRGAESYIASPRMTEKTLILKDDVRNKDLQTSAAAAASATPIIHADNSRTNLNNHINNSSVTIQSGSPLDGSTVLALLMVGG